ncbi:hypothetical protein QFZ77_003012 [Paenibacillus sp. V4I3]|uniref:hypothetical protein n=1 Tax=Paenibacillus sp. V4I3 TaxID=3042305 RepID=UPI00278783DF|nr:hypothetical protein [Paenibacillus sp. V4I3]MDQ0874353.1 hypothetical protein [Paenibacillus sp. V4I3]
MKNHKWTKIVLPTLGAVFTIIVFIVLTAMEDMGISSFVWDVKYPVQTTDKVIFFIISFLKCILLYVFLLLRKGAYIYRVIVSSVVVALTAIWLISLGWLFYSDLLEGSYGLTLSLVGEVTAITTNLIIVFACVWSLLQRKSILKRN